MKVHRVLESCLSVTDLAAAEDFYSRVLGLRFVMREAGRHVFFACDDSMILLFDPEAAKVSHFGVPGHGTSGEGHLCFRISENEIQPWRDHLAAHGVPIESEVTWPSGGHSIYFRDPSRNSLELATPKLWGFND